MTMNAAPLDKDDGIIHISQSRLIALQRDARLLRQQKPVIRSRMSGNYLSPFKGRGMEFDEARPYQPGDDIRNMDWRVTARTNKPHSKVFREERERPVLLWVDFRAPMFFGTQQCFKSVLAAKVAAILAWKGSQQGDRLGALLFSHYKHRELRPGRGKSAALHVIRHLSDFSFVANDSDQPGATDQDISHALNRLAHVARPGSLIYMISDFRFPIAGLEFTLNRLSKHNEMMLVQVSDPLEQDLPPAGLYRVTDGNNESEINSADQKLRKGYHSRFDRHQHTLSELCKRSGARYLHLSTHQTVLQGLMQEVGS